MRGTILTLLLLLVALGGASLWWLGAAVEPPQMAAPHQPATVTTVQPVDATASRGDANLTDAHSSAGGQRLQPSAAAQPAVRPFPADATWIELTVVDRDGKPLGGAEVGWYAAEARWRFEMYDSDTERSIAWRQDPLLAAAEVGWRTLAGEDGKVRIALDGYTTITGRRERLRGELSLQPGALAPTGGHRLVLDDRDQIEVRVLTHDDIPAPGVRLGLFFAAPGEEAYSYLGAGALAVTDEHGCATIASLTAHRAELLQSVSEQQHRKAHLRPFAPGFRTVAQALDLDDLPTAPVVLRLPPCGSVRVAVEHSGSGSSTPRVVTMNTGDEEAFDGWAAVSLDAHGTAVFEHVPLGKQYEFSVEDWSSAAEKHAGPRLAGERVDVTLTSDPRLVMITATLLDVDGPIAAKRVQYTIQGENAYYGRQVATDASGRFTAPLANVDDTGVLSLGPTRFSINIDFQQRGYAELPPQHLRPGINELGELRIRLPDLLASGRLVLAEGEAEARPVRWQDASLVVERFDPNSASGAEPGQGWTFHAWSKVDAATGTFTIRGEPTGARFRATPYANFLLPTAPHEFAFGAQDLTIEVQRGLPLAASLLLPAHARQEQLSCKLVTDQPLLDEDRRRSWPQHEQGQRYQLLWTALPAGRYALSVSVSGGEIVRVPDVLVPQPEGGDPRLVDIDLTTLVRSTSLHVSYGDPSEAGGDDEYFAVCVPGEGEGDARTSYGEQVVELLLPLRPVRAVVLASGCRPREVTLDKHRIEVQLDRWQQMRVRLANAPPEAERMGLTLALHGSDRDQVEQRLRELGMSDDPTMLSPSFDTFYFDDAEALVRIGDGPHRVHLSADHGEQHFEFTAVTPAVVQPSTDTIVLRVAPEEWQRAIQALKLDK